MGLLVIDEVFDGWREHKNENVHDYSTLFDQWWQRDVDAFVCRDRLHPSIFCWSTGNEVIERKKIEIVKTAHNLAERLSPLPSQHGIVTGTSMTHWLPSTTSWDTTI